MAEISKINVGGTEYDIEKDVFWATYGTTTGAEIEAAVNAGKVVLLERESRIYRFVYRVVALSIATYYFSAVVTARSYWILCDNNKWSNDWRSIEINRTTDVNQADTNYTTLMARGEKLLDATTFDAVTNWSKQLKNGAIAWRYS